MARNVVAVDTVAVLDREMYTEAEAARLLSVPQSTLHYWLEGGTRRGKVYKPIIRDEPRQTKILTWAEFVEASLLREYRRTYKVPMVELRKFVDELRERFAVPYPLADRQPYVSGRQLLYDAQTSAGLGAEYCLVAVANGQLVLTGPSAKFYQRVEWDGDVAAAWRPDPNEESPVRVSPHVRFGRPSVGGVSTETVWEQDQVGESREDIAETYGLTRTDVKWALSYEYGRRAA